MCSLLRNKSDRYQNQAARYGNRYEITLTLQIFNNSHQKYSLLIVDENGDILSSPTNRSIPYNSEALYNITSSIIGLPSSEWEEVKNLAELEDGGTYSFRNNSQLPDSPQDPTIHLAVRKLTLRSNVCLFLALLTLGYYLFDNSLPISNFDTVNFCNGRRYVV